MDRTSRIGVLVCIGLLVFLVFTTQTKRPLPAPAPLASATNALVPPGFNGAAPGATANPAPTAPPPAAAQPEQITFLENDALRATMTSRGAAIKEVELKKQKDGKTSDLILNEQAHSSILELTGWPGAESLNFTSRPVPNGLAYTAALPSGVTWVREYSLGKDYAITVKDTYANPGAAEAVLPTYGLSVGRAEPLRSGTRGRGGAANSYLGCGWLTSKAYHLTTINDFNPSSIPLIGIKTRDAKDVISSTEVDNLPLRWLGAENQFFTVLLTPTEDHQIGSARFQCFNQRDDEGKLTPSDAEPDIEATALFPEIHVPAGGSTSFTYSIYAGPKDYYQLNALGEQQGELMNYGHFEIPIILLLGILRFFHSFTGNYGVAIIMLTLLVKICTWPLQSISNHSGKKMQALAPKLKELQAKYKEQPEKLNTETFAMYREYGVNPFGGCLPAFVQMPVFFSLYYMLQNAGELRGQSFLWVHDLTQPDTVATWHHFALNPLPLMVTGLTMVMMRMTPQIGDPSQARIAQFMPLFFLIFLYNFAAALSLYYVINNCVSIIQIYRNLRKPLPELKRVPKKK
jgi:YidC/Oxa1 family membrane protein insertase